MISSLRRSRTKNIICGSFCLYMSRSYEYFSPQEKRLGPRSPVQALNFGDLVLVQVKLPQPWKVEVFHLFQTLGRIKREVGDRGSSLELVRSDSFTHSLIKCFTSCVALRISVHPPPRHSKNALIYAWNALRALFSTDSNQAERSQERPHVAPPTRNVLERPSRGVDSR